MRLGRTGGVLAHVTSLPGPLDAGDLGPSTTAFLDWAAAAGFGVWQVLPLGPTGANGSPYDGLSAFAGNFRLVSPHGLAEAGSLPRPFRPDPDASRERLLRRAFTSFREQADPRAQRALEAFVETPGRRAWLDDWVLYAALKRAHRGSAWTEWDAPIRRREGGALARASRDLADETAFERFVQWSFDVQWRRVREAAHARGLAIYGDLPFYVARDSADVWAHREIFHADADGRTLLQAGVPPDYFSENGQLWGNPVYRWDRLAARGYDWWIDRVRANLEHFDLLRLDHFRGFAAVWVVPGESRTATAGCWETGPGRPLFDALRAALGELPLVAEDLGHITDDVVALRDGLDLPGMRVAQFAFAEDGSTHLPDRVPERSVAYTGTHDNDTLAGWYAALDEPTRARARHYLDAENRDAVEIAVRLLDAVWRSPARLAVAPLQDLLALGSAARMNVPGVADGNWGWRAAEGHLTPELASRLRERAVAAGRASL